VNDRLKEFRLAEPFRLFSRESQQSYRKQFERMTRIVVASIEGMLDEKYRRGRSATRGPSCPPLRILSMPPKHFPSFVMKILKGKSAGYLRREFPESGKLFITTFIVDSYRKGRLE
jgi:hypothetical protein